MTLTSRRLALTNSLIIFGAIALFALVFVPAHSAVTLRALDEELAAMGDSFAQSPSTTTPPVTDVFAERPVFIQSRAWTAASSRDPRTSETRSCRPTPPAWRVRRTATANQHSPASR